MGVRIVVAENERIASALKRFKRLVEQHGVNGEVRKRGRLIQPKGCAFRATDTRRIKKFQKRLKARKETLIAKLEGVQPANVSAAELQAEFWNRTGKR